MADRVLVVSSDEQRMIQWKKDLSELKLLVETACDLSMVENVKPTICLIDFDALKEMDASIIKKLIQQCQETKFFVLVSLPMVKQGVEWIAFGVKGYANRLLNREVLKIAVEAILRNEIWAGKAVVQFLLQQLQNNQEQRRKAPRLETLTVRERELSKLVGQGLNNKQISEKLAITERTVKAHLNNIFKKVNVSSRVQLAIIFEQDKMKAQAEKSSL